MGILLIYYYTDVAEWVLNKCALSGVQTSLVSNNIASPDPVLIEEDGTDLGDQNENNTGNVIQMDSRLETKQSLGNQKVSKS